MIRRHFVLEFIAALVTAGCSNVDYEEVVAPPILALDGTSMVEGTTMEIAPFIATDQVEGGPTYAPVDDIRSDDPSIVRLEFATHLIDLGAGGGTTRGVIVYAVAPGTTNLRLYDGDTDEGSLSFTVVAAGQ